jgi:HEAT repeat protein
MTYLCPACWSEIGRVDRRCRRCGYTLADYETLNFEARLLLATHHPVREHQAIAVQALGRRRSGRALQRFTEILESSTDPYLCREVVYALTRYARDAARPLLLTAQRHEAALVRRAAGEVLATEALHADPEAPCA